MMNKKYIYVLTIFFIGALIGAANAQDPLAQPLKSVGFLDANKDGVNDLFTDRNGDGINDVNGEKYPHSYRFIDENNDGINDVWQDEDGDGVNDLLFSISQREKKWVDKDGDGILDGGIYQLRGKELMAHVLDNDEDGRNDITGIRYSGRDIFGYRFGNIDEERGIKEKNFVDEDEDGMNDNFYIHGHQRHNTDLFIDVDGDGIADDRGLRKMNRKGRGKWK